MDKTFDVIGVEDLIMDFALIPGSREQDNRTYLLNMS